MSDLSKQMIANLVAQLNAVNSKGGFLWVDDPGLGTDPVTQQYTYNGETSTYYRSTGGWHYDTAWGNNLGVIHQSWGSSNVPVVMGAFGIAGSYTQMTGGMQGDVLMGGWDSPDRIDGNYGNDVIFGGGDGTRCSEEKATIS